MNNTNNHIDMKSLFNRIGVCATQAAGQNTMSNTNTPRSAREMQSNNGWQVDDRVMSSESPTNHLLITYYSPTIVSMQSAAIKAVKRAYMSAWRYAAVLVITILGAWNINAWGDYKPYLAEGFEGTITLSGSSCTASNSNATANGTARTGSKVCYAYPSSASSSARYVGVGSNLTADKNWYIHAIVWVKGDNVANSKVQHQIGPYGTSPATAYVNTTTSYTRCTITPLKSGGSAKQIRLYFISNNGTPVAHFWYDDFIMYLSSENVATDLTKPSQATAASATTSSISWTNGSDTGTGATGIQNTLIWRRSSGSDNDLTLNDQGIYSLTSTQGPSTDQSGHWTLVSASVAAGATSYSGTFAAGAVYAIVHRDLAYNYSTPTYVTVAGGGCSAPTSPSISGTTAYTAGQDISLSASATGTSATTTYTWYKGANWAAASATTPVQAASTSGATFTKASCVVGDAGTYWCNISNGTGCEVQTSKTITVTAAAHKIYLKNTMGWSNAYVTLLGSGSYWDGTNGSGSYGKSTYAMTYDSGKKLFYYETSTESAYLAFTKDRQENYGNFYNTEAVYQNGGYSLDNVVWVNTNNSFYKNGTKYYGTDAPGGTALEAYSPNVYLVGYDGSWDKNATHMMTDNGDGTYSKTVSLTTGNKTYKILDNAWFGNSGTMTSSNCTNWTFTTGEGNCTITPSVAGSYTFTYNRTTNKVSVTYPVVYSVTHTLSGVTKSSGATSATENTAYSATYAASSGYVLPPTITVTIGGAAKTAGTDYTWNQSTGVVSIQAAKVTGNIVITVTGTSCPACGTVYSASTSATGNISIAANASNLALNSATHKTTVSGGSMSVYNGQGSAKNLITANGFSQTNNDTYFRIDLDCELKQGDVISVSVGKDGSNTRGVWVSSATSRPGSAPACALTAKNSSLTPVTYTVTSSDEYKGKSTLYIYRATANTTYFNTIIITRPPAQPTALAAGSISTTGATLTITDATDVNDYDIYYSTSSTAPTAGTSATTTSTSKTKDLTGLTAGTRYYAWVRSKCGDSKSEWRALTGSYFETSCVAPTTVTISGTAQFFPGEAISLSSSVTGGNGVSTTYQWYRNGAAIDGATSSSYSVAAASTTKDHAGKYTLKVTKSSNNGNCEKTSAEFHVKCWQILLKESRNGADISYNALTKVDATYGQVSLHLNGARTYGYVVTDGCNNWYGNTGTMTEANCTNWSMDDAGSCEITTNTKTADYIFKVNLTTSPVQVSVTYPGGEQEKDAIIYWDDDVTKWNSNIYYRIGRQDGGTAHTTTAAFTKVPGTAYLWKVLTPVNYVDFHYWTIGNNQGDEGSGVGVNKTKSDTKPITGAYEFQAWDVKSATYPTGVTITPSSSHEPGEESINNNCQFYATGSSTAGMKSWSATITAPTNGTITVDYTDVNNAAQSFTSGSQTLAHTCNLTITATPNEGYQLGTLTVNGAAHTNGNVHVLRANSTIAATFTARNYTVTLNNQSATTAGTTSVTATYNAAPANITCPTKTGKIFGGYWTTAGGEGSKLINDDGTWVASVPSYTGASKQWLYANNLTLYAYWIDPCYSFTPATSGSDPAVGNTISGTGSGGTMTMLGATLKYNANGLSFESSGSAKVSVVLDNNMQVGTVITAQVISNGSGSGRGLYLQNESGTAKGNWYWNPAASGETKTFTYTVTGGDGLDGSNKFIIARKTNAYLKNITIHNCGAAKVDATVYTISPATQAGWATCTAAGTKKVTLSGSQSGVSYQLYKDGVAEGDPKAGTGSALNWAITESGVYTVKSVENSTYKETAMTGTATVTIQDPTIVGETSVDVEGNITLTHPGDVATGSWATSDDSKATVSSAGVVTGVAEGSATITFTGTGGCTDTHVVSVVLPSSESCITITNFETTQHNNSSSKPDGRGKYIYGYKGTMSDANAVTMTLTETNSKGESSGTYMLLHYGNDVYIYSDNTTTGGTPTTFEDVTSVTLKVKLKKTAPSLTIKVGSTTIANTVSLSDANTSGFTTFGPYSADNLDGVISIKNNGSGSTNYDIYIDDIEICTGSSGFTLSYDANGGTGTTASQSGTSLTVKSCGFTRTGYVFDHWNTKADDSGTDYDPGDPITLTGTTTLYAQWVEEMESECSWAYYFVKASDATANSKTNNTSVFTTVLGGSPGSGGSSGSATVDGTTYTFTGGSGSVKTNTTMVVPTGKKATLYIVTKKNGTNTITVKKGSTEIGTHTPTSDWDVAQFDDLDAGTYTINSTGNLNWYLFAANICADCADSHPEITGSLTGCPTVTLTATNYTDGALLQWYKKVGSEFVALDGETDVTYTATETGLYKLAAQKTCRLETEPVSVTISLAVNSTAIPTATKTYEQGAAATPLTASVLAEGDAATTASEYKWEKKVGSGAWTEIGDATTASYTPSTAEIGTFQYRVSARNNCNEGSWVTSSAATVEVITTSTVTGSWKVDGTNVSLGAKGYVKVVNAGGWYDVKATFTTTTATPTITMMTDGVKMDNRVVEGTTITARVYVPASAADTVRVKAAVEAVTTGTPYSSCEIILKLAVTQCASNTKLPVKSSYTDAGSSYTGWRYYWETAGVGKITAKTGTSTISQESSSYEGFSYRNGSNGPEYRFQTYIGGVSKVRVYVYNDASSVRTVSNVYYHTALFTDKPSGYEISPTIIYQYPDEGGIKGKSNSYFDIVLSSPMIPNSCMAIILNNNVKIYGVELTGSSGSGTVPTLQWNQSGSATLDDIHTSPGSSLMQKASIKTPANFKSIATIQYRSTNPDIATVDNATGEVTIVSASTILVAETCSIAAKLPVSGCYAGSAEIYYRVIVDPCPDKAPVIATDRNDYCVGHEPVISITSYDGEITGWFKDGVKIPDTEGLTSITASGIGNYYVTTNKTCDVDVRSNSVVIVAAEAPSVTVLHSGWHIRRGREIGVPLQLFKVEGTNLTTTITWTLNGASHTLSGVSCSLVDGIYQMTGTPSGSGAATLTGTITVTNECGQSTTKSTTIIVDPAAANVQVAYVVKGTKGGGWTATQDDNLTGLYTYLSSVPTFDVTACNGYNTTVLEDLLTYYSQYDIVVLTDYLNSAEKPGSGNPGYNKSNNISYSDAFGCLVDVKPMLTTEAYVSGKSNWTKVGLTSNPSDGTNTDNKSLKMTLLCPAAAIFSGISPEEIDGNTYIQVADALPGGSENKMLQGFEPTAARDFVFMATVEGGDGKELITLCERQKELRARMMVFGLNWHGSEKLNADGNLAVKQIIEYLLDWNIEHIIDCAIYFDNGVSNNGDHNWGTASNWGPGHNVLPRFYQQVRIEQPCNVNIPNAVGASLKIARTSDNTVTGANGVKLNGSLSILPTGALTLNGGIYMVDSKASKKDYATKYQVPSNLLNIQSSASGQGALAFGETNNDMLPNAVVGLQSNLSFTFPATLDAYKSFVMPWQYIGTPYSNGIAYQQYYNAWMCQWDESASSTDKAWTYIDDYDRLEPFRGYALSQQTATYYCAPGKLNKPENKSFNLTKSSNTADLGGYNFLANSFTAPIDVALLEATDFEGAEASIYIYNKGTKTNWDTNGQSNSANTTTAGQFLVLPVNAAPYTSPLTVIPPMQGFFVKATSDGGTFNIDYVKSVLNIDGALRSIAKATNPLRAPRRAEAYDDDPIRVTTISLQSETSGDVVKILTGSEEFTDGFDNGWDGTKMLGDETVPMLAVAGSDADYAISSQPELEGTILKFYAGRDDEIYDLIITTHQTGLELYDMVSNVSIPLIDTTFYTFNSTNRVAHPRFVIRHKQGMTTPVDNNNGGSYLNAYAQGGQICLANNSDYRTAANVYDATGKLVQSLIIEANSKMIIDTPVAQGVYMVRMTNAEQSQTIKVTF